MKNPCPGPPGLQPRFPTALVCMSALLVVPLDLVKAKLCFFLGSKFVRMILQTRSRFEQLYLGRWYPSPSSSQPCFAHPWRPGLFYSASTSRRDGMQRASCPGPGLVQCFGALGRARILRVRFASEASSTNWHGSSPTCPSFKQTPMLYYIFYSLLFPTTCAGGYLECNPPS